MRNLKLLNVWHVPLTQEVKGIQHIDIDPDTRCIFLASSSSVFVLEPQSQEVTQCQSLLNDAAFGTQEGRNQVVGMQYLPDQRGACIATSNGNLALWTLDLNEMECMGSVASGLTLMQWSPDQELLVLTTGGETLLLMTREFDPITEIPIHSTEFGEDDFVSVGWGKKETQFHGSAGKGAARRQKEEAEGAVSWDDKQPRVSWRGDGQYFAVSAINAKTAARYIRVWSREGVLQSTSEPMNGLEQALFWKPSGALIASTQRKPNKHNVVFFEKNGLQHGEFTLSSGKEEFKVKEVMWNLDSTILAVWCQPLNTGEAGVDADKTISCVQLWTSSNYYWSLKQTLTFSAMQGDISVLMWDPEQAGQLHIVTSNGHYFCYSLSWAINRSFGQTQADPANVFVIDGSNLKVTPMRQMVVPPPMSAYQLPLPSPAAQIVSPASPAADTGRVGVLTQDNQFLLFCTDEKGSSTNGLEAKLDAAGGEGFMPQCTTPVLRSSFRILFPDCVTVFPGCITHMCWVRSDLLVCSIHGDVGVFLSTARFSDDHDLSCLQLGPPVPVEADVLGLAVNPCKPDSVAVQLSTGHILRFNPEDESVMPWDIADGEELHFQFPCTHMEVTSFNGEEAVLGLTDRFRLYVNGIEIASNCTSFAVHDEFLLLTTVNHTVRCINRNTALKDLSQLSDGKAHPFDESIRRVERGSRIVTVVTEDTKLVLQMPRGNLEVIHPRALVLATVRRKLDRLEFGAAFVIMKKHRINLNLLYDHNRSMFLENISYFLQQVSSVSDINLFLTELQEDDVTVTMYTAAYNRPTSTPFSVTNISHLTSKVDQVCDAVRQALQQKGADRYRLAILTTLVKKTEPNLKTALEMVWDLREEKREGGVGAEDALKFLLFLVDVNKLYDAALATYNFDLVLMVAEKSQMDPKEYIPFLNQLRRLEENYCKFTIDRHLKNYSSALRNIAMCGEEHFTECVELVKEHKLYVEALKLFATDCEKFRTLASDYGHYLREKNRHNEAGVVFSRAKEWQLAHDAFIAALNWRQTMCTAAELGMDRNTVADVARSMAVRLRDSKRYCESAVMFEQYAQDVEEAIVTLIEGAQWEEALRLMYMHCRTDIMETHLKEAISEACQETMATLEGQRSDMERYVARLVVVRQEKERRNKQLWDDGDRPDYMNSDLFSDTSSMTGDSIPASQYTMDSNRSTVFSKASGRSNRNRRKAEHKKWSLKEGSPYEDCALIDAIAKIISATDSMRDEINALLHVLTQFHQVTFAEDLQSQYEAFLVAIQKIMPVVWMQEASDNANVVLGPAMTSNSIAQASQQGRPAGNNDSTDPVLMVPPSLKKDVRWKLHMLQTDERFNTT